MARIAGVNIPTNKRVVIALQYIHGIGQAKAERYGDAVLDVVAGASDCVRLNGSGS